MREGKDVNYGDEALKRVAGKYIRTVSGLENNSESVTIYFKDGSRLTFDHYQECCEHVELHDVDGTNVYDFNDAMVSYAEEVSNAPLPEGHESHADSETWTFYRIVTDKGTIVMRWLGKSNGYYSERVDVTLNESEKVSETHESCPTCGAFKENWR